MKYLFILPALFFLQIPVAKSLAFADTFLQDTITDLSLLKTTAVYKAPNGKAYKVSFEADADNPASGISPTRGITRGAAAANVACDHGNKFDGSYRKAAKLSIAAHNASGTNLAKLIKRVLALDNGSIAVTKTSARIEIEDSVVTLISVYLYAIARESDEDYHIIIGTSANPSTANFFNIECSGLPPTSNPGYTKLKTVRQKVVALLGGIERCTNGYIKFTDHPKVKIIGSLFYDKEHESNIPGPSTSKPKTAWELHPITEFKIL